MRAKGRRGNLWPSWRRKELLSGLLITPESILCYREVSFFLKYFENLKTFFRIGTHGPERVPIKAAAHGPEKDAAKGSYQVAVKEGMFCVAIICDRHSRFGNPFYKRLLPVRVTGKMDSRSGNDAIISPVSRRTRSGP